jgi:2-polyprenyl-3-methyl-5-hydroxy-6-metoxy-1,4-benzoquinol methylase
LVEEDVKHFFDPDSFVSGNCPACNGNDLSPEFKKLEFQYVSCIGCRTLFVNPRPSLEMLKKFYSDSPSSRFWAEKFFKPMIESRRDKIFRPRAEYASGIFGCNKKSIIGDIGAGFGLFLEEMRRLLPDNEYVAIEPSLDMSRICQEKKLKVKCMCLEEICGMEEGFDALTAFELFEHLQDPASFLKKTFSLLKPGGHLLLTTLNGGGFDVLILWEKSKSITPPHHLNFLSPHSARFLLEKVGFDITEISTPGKLDWDIIEGMIKNEGVDLGRFWNSLAISGIETSKEELQSWISRNNLSSHMRILARKPQ